MDSDGRQAGREREREGPLSLAVGLSLRPIAGNKWPWITEETLDVMLTWN